MVKLITEASRTQLISKSKAGDNYAPDNRDKGKNRFQRRTKSSVANSVKEFNSIDMNNLFKMGILTVNINVNGETSKYVVRISFGGFTEILRDFIEKNGGKLDLRCIVRTLILGFNRDDVYVHCTCPDWKYRLDFFSHKKNQASTSKPDDPLNRPPVKTNPHDTKGDGCKHVLLVLSNNSWVIKVASVIWNYINYIKEHKEKLYAEIIFPAIYGENYKDAYQTSLTDDEDRIAGEDDRDILDIANKAGVERTRFKQGNKQGIRFAPGEDKNQLSFVPDDDIEDMD